MQYDSQNSGNLNIMVFLTMGNAKCPKLTQVYIKNKTINHLFF